MLDICYILNFRAKNKGASIILMVKETVQIQTCLVYHKFDFCNQNIRQAHLVVNDLEMYTVKPV